MKRKLRFDWVRGPLLGSGGFGSVYLATLEMKEKKKKKPKYAALPSVLAVKSASPPESCTIANESRVLDDLQGCPNIIRSFGDIVTLTADERRDLVFNLFLEYAAGGTLLDLVRRSGGGGLPEPEVRRFARSVLMGVECIHRSAYVHCDLKPENVLLVADSGSESSDSDRGCFVAKIADFGLAKKVGERRTVRGTTMYLSPEAVVFGIQEAPADVWAVGCIVLYMLTGKLPWEMKPGWTAQDLVNHIGSDRNLPDIPTWVSKMGRNFLENCFARSPFVRWSAEELLSHPFVADLDAGKVWVEEKTALPQRSNNATMQPSPPCVIDVPSSVIYISSS